MPRQLPTTTWPVLLASCWLFAAAASAADWPQWRGEHRDGRSPETGLIDDFPADGPTLAWKADGLGMGYSSVAIADGRVYVSGLDGRDGLLTCLDTDGNVLWQSRYGPEWRRTKPGARSTPTVDGDRVYVMSGMGVAWCFNALTGQAIWSLDVHGLWGGRRMEYGAHESLLISGIRLIATPGGSDATMVALDKFTGRPMWTADEPDEAAGYCAPLLVDHGGRRQVVTMMEHSVIGVNLADGRLLWRIPYDDYMPRKGREEHPDYPNTPVFADGRIFVTSGYGDGCAVLELSADGKSASVAWSNTALSSQHGGAVIADGTVYGATMKDHKHGSWIALDLATGEQHWEGRWRSHMGSAIWADGKLWVTDERTGEVGLIDATPARFTLLDSFRVANDLGEYYAHPSLADGRLYVRHDGTLYVYRVR